MRLFKKDRCYNGGNHHNFEGRYTEQPRSGSMKAEGIYDIRALFYYNVYVRDVCTWCGKTVEK